jgi:hypothetical protein
MVSPSFWKHMQLPISDAAGAAGHSGDAPAGGESPVLCSSGLCVLHVVLTLQVSQAMQLLAEIITAHEGSLQAAASTRPQQQQQAPADGSSSSAGSGGSSAEQDGMEAVLAAVLDPLLEMVRRSAEVLSPDSPARLDDGGRLDPTAHKVRLSCQLLVAAFGV